MSEPIEDDDLPRVTGALFFPASGVRGRMHLQVDGENFAMRSVPVVARLGEQDVRRLVIRSDGRGFAGVLERNPQEGDRLFVGYADTELQATSVVYGGDGSAPEPVA